MHLRLSTVRRGDKTYRYAQLVESYRREEDGRPAHRVLASLGALTDEAIANLRAALDANRSGTALVVPPRAVPVPAKPVVQANYRFLDLAVLLRTWADSGLSSLLGGLLGGTTREVAADRVITALILHRCVEPSSKIAAWRWFPTTALPELLALTPGQFNNSRIHRALEALELVDATLQAQLPHVVARTQGTSVRLFIDATDTWFVGAGPPLAAKGVDKEGVYRRRVGIVLLCDERGFPMRWETLSGRFHDATALLDMAIAAGKLDWVGDRPVVLDRAVGNAAAIDTLLQTGLRFVTALPWTEFVSSGAPIPWDDLAVLQDACASEGTTPASIAETARSVGFERARDDRFVFDLGVFDKAPARGAERLSAAVAAMRFAVRTRGKTPAEMRVLADGHGITSRSAHRHRLLLSLCEPLQLRVLAGAADHVSLDILRDVAGLPAEEQVAAFDAAVAVTGPVIHTRMAVPSETTPRVRGVLYFNPNRFLERRAADLEHVAGIEGVVAQQNRSLATGGAQKTDASALAVVYRRIVRVGLGAVLTPHIVTTEGVRTVVLDRDEKAWQRRRSVDGLAILVSHPELEITPAGLVALYFQKDVIEKDFQTIKSTIELRPIHHRTDIKLRAHVTLCMLALLLQRILDQRLKAAGLRTSAASVLRSLATAHLNLVGTGTTQLYTLTARDTVQHGLLAALGMEDLGHDDAIAKTLTPR
jgi:hypothetical protein